MMQEEKDSVDYELLKKYIQHVIACEGIDFILSGNHTKEVEFTDNQWDLLSKISEEINDSEN